MVSFNKSFLFKTKGKKWNPVDHHWMDICSSYLIDENMNKISFYITFLNYVDANYQHPRILAIVTINWKKVGFALKGLGLRS